MNLAIRKCKYSEISLLVEISLSTFTQAFEKDNDPEDFKNYVTTAFSKENLLKQLQDPDSDFYFLYADQQLAGYFKLNVAAAQSELKAEDTIELERVYVMSRFQGKGFGAFILKEVIHIATNHRKKQLWLGVWQENHGAVRFYENHGFVKFGTHPYYIGKDKQTDWLMRIDLHNFS